MQKKKLVRAGLLALMLSDPICASLAAQTARAPTVSTRESAVAQKVAGCYELLRDGWQADTDLAMFGDIPHDPVVRFELTKNAARAWDPLSASMHVTYFAVRMDSSKSRSRDLSFLTWFLLSDTGSTIRVSDPLPMAGFGLTLAPRDSNLFGTIYGFTDAVTPGVKNSASHRVTARRIPCAAVR